VRTRIRAPRPEINVLPPARQFSSAPIQDSLQTTTRENLAPGQFPGERRAKARPLTHDGLRIPYEATVPELQAAIRAPGQNRWPAFVALGYSSDPLAVWALLRSTSSPNWEVRRAACEALGLQPRAAPVVARVAEHLDDPAPCVIRTACCAVGTLGGREHRARVLELLDDRDEATRRTAVVALDRLWNRLDAERILSLNRSDPSGEVSAEAGAVLLRHVDVSSWMPLFEAWIGHPAARNRVVACGLALRFGDASLVDRIAELRLDREEAVRNAADAVLARLQGHASVGGPASAPSPTTEELQIVPATVKLVRNRTAATGAAGSRLEVAVTGSAALACYFVKANWPKPATSPIFDVTSCPMTLSFDAHSDVVAVLVKLLDRGVVHGRALAMSCRAFRIGLKAVLEASGADIRERRSSSVMG
jgi:HEAT repeat protein